MKKVLKSKSIYKDEFEPIQTKRIVESPKIPASNNTSSGFTRESEAISPFHLICPELERRVALVCAEGLKKYRDRTVSEAEVTTARYGAPLDNLIKHMKNHLNKWLAGDRSEDNLAKVAWTIQQIMHQDAECDHLNMIVNEEHQCTSRKLINEFTV